MIVAHGLVASSRWTPEPFTIALLSATTILYAVGVRALWRSAGRGQGIRGWQVVAYALAVSAMAVALLSPLAWLSDQLFSAHMTQHEILMLVAAPLLVIAHPLIAFLWALPAARRAPAAALFRGATFSRAWRVLTGPLSVFLVHGAVLWIWHNPRLYEAALRHDGLHAVQHASFLLTAALFWWAMVHGRYGRAGYGVAVFYVFLTAMHSSVLGALLTVAPGAWYPTYVATAERWGLSAIDDQQLAGLIMWVPSGVVFIVFGLALFAAWLGEADKRAALAHTSALSRGARDVA